MYQNQRVGRLYSRTLWQSVVAAILAWEINILFRNGRANMRLQFARWDSGRDSHVAHLREKIEFRASHILGTTLMLALLIITLSMMTHTSQARIRNSSIPLETYDDLVLLNTEQFIGIACALGTMLLISIVFQVKFSTLESKRFYERAMHTAVCVRV